MPEYVHCNLCGANDAKLLLVAKDRDWETGDSFNIVRCNRCGLVYVNPRPDKEELKKYYPPQAWPRALQKMDVEKATFFGLPWQRIMAARARPILAFKKGGRVLDVGCGDGYFLMYMKEKGWQAYGIEPGKVPSEYAASLGLHVTKGELKEAGYPDRYFDVVNLSHVLEHLRDPSSDLIEIKRILKDDGLLVITVPNFISLTALVFRKQWVGLKAPFHLYHFTPSTLRSILRKSGFRIVKLKHFSWEGKDTMFFSESLRYLLRNFGLYPPKRAPSLGGTSEEAISGWIRLAKGLLHFAERCIFKSIGFLADIFHLGSMITVCARKSDVDR